MARELEAYRFVEKIAEGDRVRLARGSSAHDGRLVLLKQLRGSSRRDETEQLEAELSLLRSIELPGVVRAVDVVDVHGEPTLVLVDPGGQPLDQLLASASLPFAEKLALALRLTALVGEIHRQGVVLRGVQPSIFFWNREDDTLTVCDCGIATRAMRSWPSAVGANAFVGAPHYAAPEQTGRVGRIVDRRADLYALGGTLYHLFVGRPPFVGVDIAALLHAHLARVAEPADQASSEVPPLLGAVLAKLLRKDPDDRYQTANGLAADLRRVAEGARDLALGDDDAPTTLRVRETLVGRDAEIAQLTALPTALESGRRAVVYVAGEGGVGKSALMVELARLVFARGGIHARGKCDLGVAATPYHPLAQALAELASMLLGMPETALEALRDRLDAAMGDIAPALVEVFPSIRPLFHPLAALVPAPAAESRNRLVASFVAFLTTVAASQPLTVLAIDDLQWADAASLTLLEALLRGAPVPRLGVLVAARDGEITPGGPVARFIASLDALGDDLQRMRLAPLSEAHVAVILADSLRTTVERVQRLSQVVCRKTQGNPFFVRALLESALDRGLVRHADGFEWDEAAIEASPVTEDIATLLAQKLGSLPEATRDVLTVAARVGAPIEVTLVATMLDLSLDTLDTLLEPAVSAGLVVCSETAIRFAHDRLVEAALALATPERAAIIHAELAALLLPLDESSRFFEAVDHLWLSGEAANDEERTKRSSLALVAARRASAERALDAADDYFARYAATLDPARLTLAFVATFDAQLEWAEVAYLAGNYERAEKLFAELEARARTPGERLRVRRIVIDFHERAYRFDEAIRLSFATLADVGVALPDYDAITGEHVGAEIGAFVERFQRRRDDALPIADARLTRDAIAMLVAVAVPLWSARPEALPLVLARAGSLSLDEGLAPASGAALVLLGSMLCIDRGDSEVGIATAKLGLAAQERLNHPDYACQTLFSYNAMVQFRFASALAGRAGLLAGFQRGVAVGNRQWASYCADQYPLRALLIGVPLPKVAEDIAELAPALARLEQDDSITHAEPQTHFVERMLERPETPWNLITWMADAETALAYLRASKHRGPILLYTLFRVLELLVSGEDAQAYALAKAEETLLFQPTGQLQTELANLLYALAVARGAPRDDAEADAKIAAIADRFAPLRRFGETSFAGYHALVEAVRLERAGSLEEAGAACDQAIDVFERDRVLHLLGLSNEIAARIHGAAGHARIARFYRIAARRAYERWGAPNPARRLDAELGDGAQRAPENLAANDDGESAPVDAVSLLKAARAIASEIEIEPLINTLLRIVAENAGANRAHLFLDREGKLALEAFCDADLVVVRVLPGERAELVDAPFAIANQVARTREAVVIDDVSLLPRVAALPYLAQRGRVAVLAAPIERHGKVRGVVVLENDLVPGAFSGGQADIVVALNAQIAVALENASLYDQVRARVASLAASNERLREEMSDRERAERALAESETALRHAQKMEAIGVLAGGIAHDFNNLLTIILSCSSLMLLELPRSSPSHASAQDIHRAGVSGAALTRQLLAFSQRQVVQPTDVSLRAVVADLAPMLRRLLGKETHILVGGDEAATVIHADRGQLEQILLNLVVNARDAMPDGGTIHIEVFVAEGDAGRVRLRVRDEGIGMDEATRARIFEPFFTTKPVGKGTGLGLSTVYGIVAEAKGTIDVQSAPSVGTTFEIVFPRITTSEEVQSVREPPAVTAGRRVLVVDDEYAVRALAASILGAQGYDVTTAGEANEAFAIAQRLEQSDHPLDLVLTDFLLPGINGRELAERLHTMRPSLRVLFISGYANDARLRKLLTSGEAALLAKPFTPTSLLESVSAELARA